MLSSVFRADRADWKRTSNAATCPRGATALPGDSAGILRNAAGRRVLIVASDPDATGPRTIKVTLPGVSAASPIAGSTGATLQAVRWPWSLLMPATLHVSLSPGDAWIGEIR